MIASGMGRPAPNGLEAFGTFAPTSLQRAIIEMGGQLPHTYLGKRISGLLRDLLRAISPGPIDLIVLGQRMRLHLGDNACERRLAVTPQFFDPYELRLLASMCGPGFRFVDVGANVGTYSLNVAQHCAGACKILAIEPHPVALERLRMNIALNDRTIAVAAEAVSDAAEELEIRGHGANIGSSSIHALRGRGKPYSFRVSARPLLAVIDEHGFDRIDAMKVDIEGAEDRVLLPFFRSAPEGLWPRLLIVEDNADLWRDNLLSQLEEIGYLTDPVRSGNLVLRRDRTA